MMKYLPILGRYAIGAAAAFAPTLADAGNCLLRPAPFVLQSDSVEWSMVVSRGSECIQGLRGRTMVLESVSVLEQPKAGQIILQGPSFRRSRNWGGCVQAGDRRDVGTDPWIVSRDC